MANESCKRYRKAKTKQMNLVFYPGDADIVKKLDEVPKKATYIKKLIRDDIEKDAADED